MYARTEQEGTVSGQVNRSYTTVPYSGTMKDALDRMVGDGNNVAVVMDQDHLVGVVTVADIVHLAAEGTDLSNTSIRTHMEACTLSGAQPCIQVREDENLENVLKAMQHSGQNEVLVVTAENKVVGTLRALDVLKGWKKGV